VAQGPRGVAAGIPTVRSGLIRAPGMTSMERVFAAGEIATAGGFVVDAMASGKRAGRCCGTLLCFEPP